MKILFVTPYLPDEQAGAAGAQLIYRIITGLAPRHQVHLVAFVNPGDDPAELRTLGVQVHPLPLARRYGSSGPPIWKLAGRRLFDLLLSLLLRRPFQLQKYRRRRASRLITQLVAEHGIDLIQCEFNVMAPNVLALGDPAVPKLLVEHDVSIKPFARMKGASRSLGGRLQGALQYRFWLRTEPRLCNRFDQVVTLTSDDKSLLEKHGVRVPVEVIPPPIHVRPQAGVPKEQAVCFVGSYNRQANREALEELLVDLWPLIRAARPEAELRLAGKYLEGSLLDRVNATAGVSQAGFVADIDRFIARCSVFLAPIRLGGGLKMKITHALACGTPVVTTSVGGEGIDISAGSGLLVADEGADLVSQTVALLADPQKVAKLSAAAAREVREKFSLEGALASYERIYNQLAAIGPQ